MVITAVTILPEFSLVPGMQERKFKCFFYCFESTRMKSIWEKNRPVALSHRPTMWPGQSSMLCSLSRASALSFEGCYRLGCFKCLRVKSYLLNLRSLKIYGGTCYIRLDEAGPAKSTLAREQTPSSNARSKRKNASPLSPATRLPSKAELVTWLPGQVECVS